MDRVAQLYVLTPPQLHLIEYFLWHWMDILTGILFNSAILNQEVEAVLKGIASIALRVSLFVNRRTHV